MTCDDDLRQVLTGAGTLLELSAAAARVHRALYIAMAEKARLEKGCIAPNAAATAEQIHIANAVGVRLLALESSYDTRVSALQARGRRLMVSDVKRVAKGTVSLYVIRSQDYDSVSLLDNTDMMFEDPFEPLGYFQGDEDDDPVRVGSGGDLWYVADLKTLEALGGVPPPPP